MFARYQIITAGLALTTMLAIAFSPEGMAVSETEQSRRLVAEVWSLIDDNFFDGTFNNQDWAAIGLQYTKKTKYHSKKQAYQAIREMLAKLDDPFTRFLDPGEQEKQSQLTGAGSYIGIGITTDDTIGRPSTVAAVLKDSAAELAGIRTADLIVAVNGKKVEAMPKGQMVVAIRRAATPTIVLNIQRGKKTLTIPVEREVIKIPSLSSDWKASERIGYIRLHTFSLESDGQMTEAIRNLEPKNPRGYILDLRGNFGGIISAAVDIGSMWLGDANIGTIRDRDNSCRRNITIVEDINTCQIRHKTYRSLTEKPLVVLVDRSTASASELLTGALQEQKRAIVVGETTFGKGISQEYQMLNDGASLTFSDVQFLTPQGRRIQKVGIKPNIEVILTAAERQNLLQNERKVGTREDRQYIKALDILKSMTTR
jgi:carboxyl-terminal processing protease